MPVDEEVADYAKELTRRVSSVLGENLRGAVGAARSSLTTVAHRPGSSLSSPVSHLRAHAKMSRQMDSISVRRVRQQDAVPLAELWIEFGRYYAELDPIQFQVPADDSLVDWFEGRLSEPDGADALWLLAEHGQRVVGAIQARIWRPSEDAERQIVREVGHVVLKIDSIVVTESERRGGIGRALMDAVEHWGRERGASEAVVISYAFSPTSVPFYEKGVGYDRKTIGFWKSLG
jgi:GNAT superfamily N-acetyltransferase